MSIKIQINELPSETIEIQYSSPTSPYLVAEDKLDIAQLKALAESHDRLLEAAKFLRDRLIYRYHENPHSDYFIAIKEAEKL